MLCVELCSNSRALNGFLFSVGEVEKLKTQLAEYAELKAAARTLVEMVDPPEDGAEMTQTLVEWLKKAPQRIVEYLSDNTKLYVAHVLGLVKFYWPQANLVPLG